MMAPKNKKKFKKEELFDDEEEKDEWSDFAGDEFDKDYGY
jgi:hypothetical protein